MKIFCCLAILLAVTGSISIIFGQDPAKLSPNIYKVLLDNDQVRVLEINLKPGEKSPMHSHPNSVIYAMSGGTVEFKTPDGKANVIAFKPGQCLWRPAETHEPHNVGSETEVHALQIELKK